MSSFPGSRLDDSTMLLMDWLRTMKEHIEALAVRAEEAADRAEQAAKATGEPDGEGSA